jgi:hypothetical protein
MGAAMEVIGVAATAPGATFTAGAAVTGNSLTIRDSRAPAYLLAVWQDRQTAGGTRILSPLLHDNTIGMTAIETTGCRMLRHPGVKQPLRAQDNLTVNISGSVTAGDIENSSFLVAYDDLPGVNGKFITAEDCMRRAVNLYSSYQTISTGTSGGWSGDEAINAEQDALKANTDYALIGYMTSVEACSLRWVSPDWGNLGVGGPGMVDDFGMTENWFLNMSLVLGMATIPVFNSSNKGLTIVSALQDENGGDPIVTSLLVELSPKK